MFHIEKLKKILSTNLFLYKKISKIYHFFIELFIFFTLSLTKVKYLKPRKASGKFKSQYGQDYYLHNLKLIKKKGFFVEVGCNDPIYNSNSYFLEKHLQYSGISIDGIDFKKEFKKLRPKTKFFNRIIDKKKGIKKFYKVIDVEGWENQMSTLHKNNLKTGKTFNAKIIKVKSTPLNNLIPKQKIIDILMIDVEGHELNVLKSINLKKYKPKVILIENTGYFIKKKKLVNYIEKNLYRHFARIGRSDDIFVRLLK